MSLPQNPLSNSSYRMKFYFPSNTNHCHLTGNPKFSVSPNPSNPSVFQTLSNNGFPLQSSLYLSLNRHWHIKPYDSSRFDFQEHQRSNKLFDFDVFLTILESLCVASSSVISAGCIVNWVFFRQRNSGLVALGNRILVWLLAEAVVVGSVIRRRRWRRICWPPPSKSTTGAENWNVIERIEMLDESMRSATTIIQILSRQLEKLGIRFRVTRKAFREPISEDQQQKQLGAHSCNSLEWEAS